MDIVVTGYAGFEGSLIIYNQAECREKLLNRYSKSFFRVFENRENAGQTPGPGAEQTDAEKTGAVQSGAPDAFEALYRRMEAEGLAADASEGGVLSALWKVLKANRSGGTYSQRAIPILQQTIEVCEMFAVNPYRLHAPGCRVWLMKDTGILAREAAVAGVPLRVIGFTSKGVAIKRTDAEGDSSLRRPEEDELRRLNIEEKR